jgi:nucleotide-binding universal stress UspA family protein
LEVKKKMKLTMKLTNGVHVINCTPHELKFEDGTVVPPSGYLVQAKMDEVVEKKGAYELATVRVVPTPEGEKELTEIEQRYPDAIVLGSAISAQAYPRRVKMVVLTKARASVSEKVCRIDKFSVYPATSSEKRDPEEEGVNPL